MAWNCSCEAVAAKLGIMLKVMLGFRFSGAAVQTAARGFGLRASLRCCHRAAAALAAASGRSSALRRRAGRLPLRLLLLGARIHRLLGRPDHLGALVVVALQGVRRAAAGAAEFSRPVSAVAAAHAGCFHGHASAFGGARSSLQAQLQRCSKQVVQPRSPSPLRPAWRNG